MGDNTQLILLFMFRALLTPYLLQAVSVIQLTCLEARVGISHGKKLLEIE